MMRSQPHPLPLSSPTMLVACLAFLAGCPMRANPNLPDGASCDPMTHICVGTITITSPVSPAYTNETVSIQVTASPAENPPERIQILKDGTPLVTVSYPFTYVWDTSNEAEGDHEVTASAEVGAHKITAAPVIVRVDRRPPSIERRAPAPSASNVALSDPMEVVFSEVLDPSSVTSAAISLSSAGSTLNTSSTLDPDGKTVKVRFLAHPSLSFPATVTATVNPGVRDLAGNPVGAVGSWSWNAPLWVKLPSTPGYIASVAIDSGDVPVLASVSEAGALTVARYAPGAIWDLGLGTPVTGPVVSATASADDMGAPVVAWTEDHVRVARWNGAAWERLAGDADTGATPATNLAVASLAFHSSGAVLVGWTGFSGSNNLGHVARWAGPGSAWQLLPDGSGAGPGGPQLQMEASGVPIGVFTGSFGMPARPVRRFANGAWTSLDTTNAGEVLYTLALDGQDRPVILAREAQAAAEVIHVRVYNGAGWVPLVPPLSTGSTRRVGYAQVALGPDDRPFVLWNQEIEGSLYHLHLARFNGTAWDTSYGVLVSLLSNGNESADLALGASGLPTVAWVERTSSTGANAVHVWKSNY